MPVTSTCSTREEGGASGTAHTVVPTSSAAHAAAIANEVRKRFHYSAISHRIQSASYRANKTFLRENVICQVYNGFSIYYA